MHLLLSAYACRPHAGTEAGNGWGWATHLALRGIRVNVLTASSNRASIDEEQQREPIANLSFTFVDPALARLREGHGWHYLAWQFAALAVARKLHATDPFDIAHHVTYGSIHVPSQLWSLGVPLVFGPVGGGQISPFSMRSYFGAQQRKELLRSAFTRLLRLSPVHRRWIKRMTIVFATNDETLKLARHLGKKDAVLCLDTGLPEAFFADAPRSFQEQEGPLRLLWTGRMLPRKALSLTLDAIAEARTNLTLTILGDGYPPQLLRQMIAERGLEDRVMWSGKRVPWSEVREAYRVHDAFLFTSLRDSCAAQLLEAMALGLPIITLDLHGGHNLVPSEAGIKVPVTDKKSTIAAIARAIETFASSSIEQRNSMSRCGWEAARQLAWSVRAERAEKLYERILAAPLPEKGRGANGPKVNTPEVMPI